MPSRRWPAISSGTRCAARSRPGRWARATAPEHSRRCWATSSTSARCSVASSSDLAARDDAGWAPLRRRRDRGRRRLRRRCGMTILRPLSGDPGTRACARRPAGRAGRAAPGVGEHRARARRPGHGRLGRPCGCRLRRPVPRRGLPAGLGGSPLRRVRGGPAPPGRGAGGGPARVSWAVADARRGPAACRRPRQPAGDGAGAAPDPAQRAAAADLHRKEIDQLELVQLAERRHAAGLAALHGGRPPLRRSARTSSSRTGSTTRGPTTR